MGIFDKYRIDEKNPTKVTYSEDDLKKIDLMYAKEFPIPREQHVYSPCKKETPKAIITQIRDYGFERILDNHLFTFKHMLVIPNPYSVAAQTALVLFNSSKEGYVRYEVLGKTPEVNFSGETPLSHRHRVNIMGLYQGTTNKIKMELVDQDGNVMKRRNLTIYIPSVATNTEKLVSSMEHKEESHFSFLLVNGIRFNPIAIDQNGDLRYGLQLKTNALGMIPLKNGRFLFPDKNANVVGKDGESSSCQYHEMDYMGRIYKTFLFPFTVDKAVAQDEDSLFLVTDSSEEKEGIPLLK